MSPEISWFPGVSLRSGESPLEMLVLQPTPFCNIDCSYCYLGNKDSTSRLSLDLISTIFARLKASGLLGKQLTVLWHAGEPLVLPVAYYSSAFKLIEDETRGRSSVKHAIQSNGTLLSEDFCGLFKKHNVHLGLSIDGPEFIHDRYRKTRNGRGTFMKVMKGVQLAQQHHIEFSVIAVLTDYSLDYPDEIFSFFKQLGVTEIGLNVEEIEGVNRLSSLARNKSEARFRSFIKRFYELNRDNGFPLNVREFDQIRCSAIKGNEPFSTVLNPLSIISIDVNGNYSTYSPELLGASHSDYANFVFGNVRTEPFEQIYQNPVFNGIRNAITEGVELCRSECEYFSVCGGGSPSNKLFENGSFASSETMACKMIKMIVTDVLLDEIESELSRTRLVQGSQIKKRP